MDADHVMSPGVVDMIDNALPGAQKFVLIGLAIGSAMALLKRRQFLPIFAGNAMIAVTSYPAYHFLIDNPLIERKNTCPTCVAMRASIIGAAAGIAMTAATMRQTNLPTVMKFAPAALATYAGAVAHDQVAKQAHHFLTDQRHAVDKIAHTADKSK